MERDLEDEELRWLIDAVLFSKAMTASQAQRLIKKLERFGTKYFEPKVSHVRTTPNIPRTKNAHVMMNVSAINDAIDMKKKISFRYNSYGTDFKLHDKGRDYKANPYQMIAANGYYYLLSNLDVYDNIAYFRIDKITNVRILDEKVKPMKQVKGLENGLDLPKHIAEHIYMFTGASKTVKLRCRKEAADAIADWFGRDVRVLAQDDDGFTVQLTCNLNAMYYWALQYGHLVEVLEPAELRAEIKEAIDEMAKRYAKETLIK